MKYWPADTFEIESSLPRGEVIERLGRNIEPRKILRFFGKHVYFQGRVDSSGFEVTRIIKYRNSFLPIIKGNFADHDSGTTITITMQLQPLVVAFMCVWFGLAGLFLLGFALAASVGAIFVLPKLLFGWALATGGFWFEAGKQKKFLISLLSGLGRKAQQLADDLNIRQ